MISALSKAGIMKKAVISGERKSHIMLSVTSLKGEGGYTDDAALFNDIGKDLKENETLECHVNKRIRLLFIVTDGASSFPSAAKKALQTLKKRDAYLSYRDFI